MPKLRTVLHDGICCRVLGLRGGLGVRLFLLVPVPTQDKQPLGRPRLITTLKHSGGMPLVIGRVANSELAV